MIPVHIFRYGYAFGQVPFCTRNTLPENMTQCHASMAEKNKKTSWSALSSFLPSNSFFSFCLNSWQWTQRRQIFLLGCTLRTPCLDKYIAVARRSECNWELDVSELSVNHAFIIMLLATGPGLSLAARTCLPQTQFLPLKKLVNALRSRAKGKDGVIFTVQPLSFWSLAGIN